MEKGPFQLDLSSVDGYSKTYMDIVVEDLKTRGLYHPQLCFRGFDGSVTQTVISEGTETPESDEIFCSTETLARQEIGENNPIEFAFDYDNPALAVYDGRKLIISPEEDQAKFRDLRNKLESLVVVYHFKT